MNRIAAGFALLLLVALTAMAAWPVAAPLEPANRDAEEVVFWHFWGGADRKVVEQVTERFNAGQTRYRVRPVAMPGNNLDLKVFLAVTGGNPPDLINQDDPILGDWAARDALEPLDKFIAAEELQSLSRWLFPAARRLGTVEGRLYGVCNGLDIRALYYNQSLLTELNEIPPATLEELDALSARLTPPSRLRYDRYTFLPDARRLWSWAPVFGGGFPVDEQGNVNLDSAENRRALQWMMGYRERYGGSNLAAFRTGDQSLPGKTFPLFSGRYLFVMDGQWRVRDIRASQQAQRERGEAVTQYGVMPLPPPNGGRADAGWVNGNFFVVPRGAKCPQGAWEFMKFWSGFGGQETAAAETAVAGGWIPVSQQVVQQPLFQAFLREEPLFAEFVRLAGSENQFPVPVIPGAALLRREVENVGERALYDDSAASAADLLQQAQRTVHDHLARQSRGLE
jgi:multiple sugar transport system substrate-binding protein